MEGLIMNDDIIEKLFDNARPIEELDTKGLAKELTFDGVVELELEEGEKKIEAILNKDLYDIHCMISKMTFYKDAGLSTLEEFKKELEENLSKIKPRFKKGSKLTGIMWTDNLGEEFIEWRDESRDYVFYSDDPITRYFKIINNEN